LGNRKMANKNPLGKNVIGRAKTNETVLEVTNLCTSIKTSSGTLQLLKDINFSIQHNKTLALVGESGSGKSITALSITRLLDEKYSQISGSVLLEGQELLKLSESGMRSIRGRKFGMVFQEAMTSLNPLQSIGSQIAEVLIIHKFLGRQEAKREAINLLDQVRIPAAKIRSNDLPSSLSGGMRQRVMIAMALACKPKLLIADEPTTALDVTIQAQILNLIKELQNDYGMAVLFITHDMGIVAEIADFTLVMRNGVNIESGKTEDLFSQPQNKYTQALIASVPRLSSDNVSSMTGKLFTAKAKSKLPEGFQKKLNSDILASDCVLSVQSLVKRFDVSKGLMGQVSGRIHAVEDVSFNLLSGQTLSLVGESGCGKSTTARTVMRLLDFEGGKIKIAGEDVTNISKNDMRKMRRNIQMIFQDPLASLNPKMRVGFSVAEPFLTHGLGSKTEAKTKVLELLEMVGIDPSAASRFPQQFSGGQRQRICIARALILNPKVIIADEAVSSLDVSTKAEVVNLLIDLQKRYNLSLLFISHDIAIVERISHHVGVMYKGEIVEMGPTEKVFKDPQHPYTQKLLAAVPVPDPSRRFTKRKPDLEEIENPVRSLDYVPEKRTYRVVSENHTVQLTS
jgi:peptide/nickel transport system ATP-binding protein